MTKDESLFAAALAVVLAHEGGFVDDPVDPGGATNYGISLRFLRAEIAADRAALEVYDVDADGDVDADDMRRLTRDQAGELYRSAFWDRYGFGRLADEIAIKTFDLAVNMGARQAVKLLQRAVRACGVDGVADDGVLGPITLGAVRRIDGDLGPYALRAALRSEAAGFYRALIAARPPFEKYRRGWLNRAYA